MLLSSQDLTYYLIVTKYSASNVYFLVVFRNHTTWPGIYCYCNNSLYLVCFLFNIVLGLPNLKM